MMKQERGHRLDTGNERQLVIDCLNGDREAYAVLVKRYAKQVFAMCLGILGKVSDAEDMAQETLIRGFTRINQLRESEQFRSWIMTIARNLCIDFVRRGKIQNETLAMQDCHRYSFPQEYTELHDAISKLPEKYRLPLMLYYFDGQSSESVAITLNVTPAGVLTRLSRARKELRKLLDLKGGIR